MQPLNPRIYSYIIICPFFCGTVCLWFSGLRWAPGWILTFSYDAIVIAQLSTTLWSSIPIAIVSPLCLFQTPQLLISPRCTSGHSLQLWGARQRLGFSVLADEPARWWNQLWRIKFNDGKVGGWDRFYMVLHPLTTHPLSSLGFPSQQTISTWWGCATQEALRALAETPPWDPWYHRVIGDGWRSYGTGKTWRGNLGLLVGKRSISPICVRHMGYGALTYHTHTHILSIHIYSWMIFDVRSSIANIFFGGLMAIWSHLDCWCPLPKV